MLRIGITGGIGSGKTTVARIFEVLGIPVYYADDAAKRLMNEDEELQQKIIEWRSSL
jgi:dephospho-CoA kinase